MRKLLLAFLFATVLGTALLMIGPVFGGILAFGIVGGCLFRGLYLLNEMYKKLKKIVPDSDQVSEIYEAYMKDLELKNQKA